MKHKEAFDIIHIALKKLGAKKGGRSTSIIKNDHLTKSVELQKSNFGNYSYLNVCLNVNAVLTPGLRNQIGLAYAQEDAAAISLVQRTFDFDTPISDEARKAQIEDIVEKYVISCLCKFDNEDDVRKFLLNEKRPLNHIPLLVKAYFGIK